ncbi:hypothetical protein [Reyranella sp.]|uniref:hypothetical protein n=1 Tax=Reyranella sp. TaxID=1929291 RepID=UPI003D10065C
MPPWIGLVALALTLGSCAPASLVPYDRNTKYQVDTASSGFTLTVDYSRSHFIPEPDAVEEACKNAFVTVAQDVAAKRGRRVQQIDEQQIATKLGSNEHNNLLYCTATGLVAWQ